jgi:dCTP deaminase
VILVDKDIKKYMESGDIVIEPFDPACLGTNSYDVHLARTLLAFKPSRIDAATGRPLGDTPSSSPYYTDVVLDCKIEPEMEEIVIPDEGYILRPGRLYLASTIEYTEVHKHVSFLEGKSSLGRLGLSIHVTAGKGDVGFCGHWVAELTTVHSIRVCAGMPIGQLIYHEVSSQPDVDYASKSSQKYAAQHTRSFDPKPVASKMYKNFPDGQPLKKP